MTPTHRFSLGSGVMRDLGAWYTWQVFVVDTDEGGFDPLKHVCSYNNEINMGERFGASFD